MTRTVLHRQSPGYQGEGFNHSSSRRARPINTIFPLLVTQGYPGQGRRESPEELKGSQEPADKQLRRARLKIMLALHPIARRTEPIPKHAKRPLRLQYLDMILDECQTQYTDTMPVDVWNVHNYVLREGATGWGCGIPPGTDPQLAIEYRIQDHDNMEYWEGHIISMREWMRDRGYQERPLIISEFGILMPWFYGYDYPRVRDFMLATFDWMRTTTDTLTGSPADDYRLVQAWGWYSLAQSTFEGFPVESHFFDPETKSITDLGLDFGAYTAPLTTPFPGTIDLQPVSIRHTRPVPEGGTLVTMTITADLYNGGAAEATGVLVRFERDGAQAGEVTILGIAPGSVETASVLWPDLTPGQIYQVTATVEADEQTVECNPYNNDLTDLLLVPKHWVYLPRIFRHG